MIDTWTQSDMQTLQGAARTFCMCTISTQILVLLNTTLCETKDNLPYSSLIVQT